MGSPPSSPSSPSPRVCLGDGGHQRDQDIKTRVLTCPSPYESPELATLHQHPPTPSYTPQASSISTHPSPSRHTCYSLTSLLTPRGVLGGLAKPAWRPLAVQDGKKRAAIHLSETNPASHQLSTLGQMGWPCGAGHRLNGDCGNKPIGWPELFSQNTAPGT